MPSSERRTGVDVRAEQAHAFDAQERAHDAQAFGIEGRCGSS